MTYFLAFSVMRLALSEIRLLNPATLSQKFSIAVSDADDVFGRVSVH